MNSLRGTATLTLMYDTSRDELGKVLIEHRVLTASEVARASALASSSDLSLDQAVLKLGLAEEDEVLPVVAACLGAKYYSRQSDIFVDKDYLRVLSHDYCFLHKVVPVVDRLGVQSLATSNPLRDELLDEVYFLVGKRLPRVVVSTSLLRRLVDTDKASVEQAAATETAEGVIQADRETYLQNEADGPTIRVVSRIFEEAVTCGASDVHFEANEDGFRVRFRVNGVLRRYRLDEISSQAAIFARVKVLASMNVSERRLPQDGRMAVNILGRKVDFRVSSIPTSFGESIVCRVLDPTALRLGWSNLGFESGVIKEIVNIIEQPSGLFLITGPTGSGKTTTLYTALSHLNDHKKKLITIEDPIEYNLKGVEQVQVHEAIGLTFAKVLRSMLRQDPDILMIGEIRDQETAEIACRAALVGRMVLSTLHTSSPRGAVSRLQDLGVPKYIVNEVLHGVLGQRLENMGDERRRLVTELVTFQ